jgi:hypothetical protein
MRDQHSTHEPDPEGSSAAAHGGTSDHVDVGHGDDDHGAAALGPIDVAAWGAGILGIGVAIAMTLAFMIATSGLG